MFLPLPKGVPMFFRHCFVALGLALSGLPAVAQTAEPTSTTATYGNWTVSCIMAQPATGDAAPVKVCEMKTQLNLKGQDGQSRPLLQLAVGQPPGSATARMVVQVPVDVALREPVAVSLDQGPATDAQTPVPQEQLFAATYLACTPTGCLADSAVTDEVIGKLRGAKTTNVTFTSLQGGKKITVPVPMTGFADAADALGLAGK